MPSATFTAPWASSARRSKTPMSQVGAGGTGGPPPHSGWGSSMVARRGFAGVGRPAPVSPHPHQPPPPAAAAAAVAMADLEDAWLGGIKQMAMALPPDHPLFFSAQRELKRSAQGAWCSVQVSVAQLELPRQLPPHSSLPLQAGARCCGAAGAAAAAGRCAGRRGVAAL